MPERQRWRTEAADLEVLLDGVRGGVAVDREAVARVVESTATLMARFPQIVELDLNPMLATAEGVVVVDARLIRD